jgi:hypothetical protein
MKQASILEKGVKEWNAWREANPKIEIKLGGIIYQYVLGAEVKSHRNYQYNEIGFRVKRNHF